MTGIERILALWRQLEAAGEDFVLATIVAVQGSSYRKPGASMLIAPDGRRAGTVSGGCLEAQVAERAWWLTKDGPVVRPYSTMEDDGERPYGSGCGGIISLLLERRASAHPLLASLEQAFARRAALAAATVLEGPRIGLRAFAGLDEPLADTPAPHSRLHEIAVEALTKRAPVEGRIDLDGMETRVWAGYRAARPGLWIFSAGDDAQPLARLARQLGWFVAVADGRSHLATRDRFPQADEVHVLAVQDLPSARPLALQGFRPQDAAVVMTHSFEQDSHALATLLALDAKPAYIGVLGPQRRTRELLAEAARLLGQRSGGVEETDALVERWLSGLHAPTGLDLGAESPETIALSILAEIQKCLAGATGRPLHELRTTALAHAS